jgi:hypothetical protein
MGGFRGAGEIPCSGRHSDSFGSCRSAAFRPLIAHYFRFGFLSSDSWHISSKLGPLSQEFVRTLPKIENRSRTHSDFLRPQNVVFGRIPYEKDFRRIHLERPCRIPVHSRIRLHHAGTERKERSSVQSWLDPFCHYRNRVRIREVGDAEYLRSRFFHYPHELLGIRSKAHPFNVFPYEPFEIRDFIGRKGDFKVLAHRLHTFEIPNHQFHRVRSGGMLGLESRIFLKTFEQKRERPLSGGFFFKKGSVEVESDGFDHGNGTVKITTGSTC